MMGEERKNTRARLIMPDWMDRTSREFRECMTSLQDNGSTLRQKLECINTAVTALQRISPAVPHEKIKASQVIEQLLPREEKRPTMESLGVSAEEFVRTMRSYVTHETRTMRAASLRLIRCTIEREGVVEQLISMGVYYFVCRSFEREKSGPWERLEALKVIRQTSQCYPDLLPSYCINSIAAIAVPEKDKKEAFSRTALDSLTEIAIRNPAAVAQANQMHVLFDAILDFPYDSEGKKSTDDFSEKRQSAIIGAILYLLNSDLRNHIHLKTHLPIILAPITDAVHRQSADLLPGIYWSCKAIVTMMRSWSGFFVLSSEGALNLIVSALTLPNIDVKRHVIDSLFEIIHSKIPSKDEDPFAFITMNPGREIKIQGTSDGRIELPPKTMRHSLIDNFLAAKLQALIDAGLAKGLVELEHQMRKSAVSTGGGSREYQLAVEATLLIGKVLSLSNTLLPATQCARLQTLEELVKRALKFKGDPQRRSRASTMITNLHYFFKTNSTVSETPLGASRYKRVRGQDKRLDRLDDVKKKIDLRMDAGEFRQYLQISSVLQTKEWNRWDWNVISDIVEGPLENPALLQAASRTKFIKRLISFLRPSNSAFASIPKKNENSAKYTQIACHLLEILVADEDGKKFLESNPLLPQIGELLKLEVEPSHAGSCKYERLFTKEKLLRTLAPDYFAMIGTLSGSKAGVDFLVRFKIFEYLPALCLVPERPDLGTIIMTFLDYNVSFSPARIVLQKALFSDNALVRFRVTRHLQALYRSSAFEFHDWGIKFAVKLLNDDDQRVAKLAMEILDEASDDVQCLESIITRNPKDLESKGKAGKDLIMRFLTRKSGFAILSDGNGSFIRTELDYWIKKGYLEYCFTVEQHLTDSLNQAEPPPVHILPHFFHDLASTSQGCQVVDESRCFDMFCSLIRDDKQPSFHRKAALWAVGNIGRSTTGLKYILQKDSDILGYICELTSTSSCLSLRGTCFFVLGLLSNTEQGREVLDDLGWDSPDDLRLLISVPKEIKESGFLKVDPSSSHKSLDVPTIPQWGCFPEKSAEANVIAAVELMVNPIRRGKAHEDLKSMKAKTPELFKDSRLYLSILYRLGVLSTRLEVRRITYELFASCVPSPEDFEGLAFSQKTTDIRKRDKEREKEEEAS